MVYCVQRRAFRAHLVDELHADRRSPQSSLRPLVRMHERTALPGFDFPYAREGIGDVVGELECDAELAAHLYAEGIGVPWHHDFCGGPEDARRVAE